MPRRNLSTPHPHTFILTTPTQNSPRHQLTWADFYLAGIIDYLNYLAKQDLTANQPNLRRVIDNVTSLDGVQNWIDQRPATEI